MKHKKNIILTISIIALIVIAMVLGIVQLGNKSSKTKKVKFTDERAQELVYNSHVYYMLSSGNVVQSNKELVLEDEKYYGIDTNLKLTSLADLDKIMNESFSEEAQISVYEGLHENEGRRLFYVDGDLYTNKIIPDENCDMKSIDLSSYSTTKEKDYYIIKFMINKKDKLLIYDSAVIYENGKWVLASPLKMCDTEESDS